MNQYDLENVIFLHYSWLHDLPGGEKANLNGADLRWADLSEANLRGANLRKANLRWADLRWADLRGAAVVIRGLTWNVYITRDHIRIGCQSHVLADWQTFTDARISIMHDDALEFWTANKTWILAQCAELSKTPVSTKEPNNA